MSLRPDVAKEIAERATEVSVPPVYDLQIKKTWRDTRWLRTYEE